jgi:hypothetical protein
LLIAHGVSPSWTAPPRLQNGMFPKFVSRQGRSLFVITVMVTGMVSSFSMAFGLTLAHIFAPGIPFDMLRDAGQFNA